IPACYDDDDDYDSAITPILSTKEPVDSLKIEDDNLRGKLLNVHLLIANIEALKDNPTQSFELLTKSSSTSLNSFLEETSTFHTSLPKFENFYFDLGEISSDSTTTHSDISLPDYEAFYFDDDHIKEISSGSTTTHSDISLSEYDSFIFEEFVDELAHIISPPEYDRFYFKDLPDQSELMSVLNFGIGENLLSTTLVNVPIEDDYSLLLAYVVKENQEKDKNRIKTGQKREAWRSWEKFKAVAVERGRKTKENKKRMAENAYTYQKLLNF
nr:hypothetical protein [Tanacetum cinerariifolium]